MRRIRRGAAAGALLLGAVLLLGACASVPPPAERVINFGFEDVVTEGPKWPEALVKLREVRATGVSLAAGRLDWSAVPRPEHPERESSRVADSGEDYVRLALDGLADTDGAAPLGVTLTVDALIPRWIAREPGLAGVQADGTASTSFASVSAWQHGPVGDALVEFVAELSHAYRPEAIALTEFLFDRATFGDDDLESFRETSGRGDWPRLESGRIDEGHPELGHWRSRVLAEVAGRAREAAAAHGVRLEVDVRAPLGDPAGDRAESGHDYGVLLGAADRIVVWDYFALSGAGPGRSRELAEGLSSLGDGRVAQSIGLWGSERTVSPAELGRALAGAAAGGADAVSVTPASLLTPEHWAEIERAWAP